MGMFPPGLKAFRSSRQSTKGSTVSPRPRADDSIRKKYALSKYDKSLSPTESYIRPKGSAIMPVEDSTLKVDEKFEAVSVQLVDPRRTWYNNRRIIALNGWILLLLITSMTTGYDGSMMNGLQSLPQWQSAFGYPTGGKLGLLNCIQTIGAVCALPFAPYLADGLGRRLSVFVGASIMIIATVIQTASQSVSMFIGARFLVGFGQTFAATAAPLLITEIAYPPYRAPLTSFYNSLYYGGTIVAAWTTFGTFKISSTWSWRTPSALQGLPAVLQFVLILFAPESPRWLISKKKDSKALKTLAYYHADGDESDPLVTSEYEEIKAAIEMERQMKTAIGWKGLFGTVGNRRRMLIIIAIAIFSQWSGHGLILFYLTKIMKSIGIVNPTIQLLINGILQIWNLIWAVFAASLVDKLGRRVLFLTSALGMLVNFTLFTICSALYAEHGSKGAEYAVLVFIFLFGAFFSIAFTPLIISYTVEILPYHLRAKGFTIFSLSLNVALIFNQYVNPIALDRIHWKYYIFYICWLAFEVVFLYLFIVETKNRTLEETAALFDSVDVSGQSPADGILGIHRHRTPPARGDDDGCISKESKVFSHILSRVNVLDTTQCDVRVTNLACYGYDSFDFL